MIETEQLADRVAAAEVKVLAARDALQEAAEGLAGLWSATASPDADESSDDEPEGSVAGATELETAIGALLSVFNEAKDAYEQGAAPLVASVATWSAESQASIAALKSLADRVESEAESIADAIDDLAQSLSDGSKALGDAMGELKTAAEALFAAVDQVLRSDLDAAFVLVAERTPAVLTQSIQARAAEATKMASAVLTNFSGEIDRTLATLTAELNEAIKALGSNVEDKAKAEIARGVRDIIEAAIQRLLNTIVTSITGAQIGAQVTASLASFLPYLIAIKIALDAIRELIRLYKMAKVF